MRLFPQTERLSRRFEGCENDACSFPGSAVHVDSRDTSESVPRDDEYSTYLDDLLSSHCFSNCSALGIAADGVAVDVVVDDDDFDDNAAGSAMATNTRFSHGAACVVTLANDNDFSQTLSDDISAGLDNLAHQADAVGIVLDVCLLLMN